MMSYYVIITLVHMEFSFNCPPHTYHIINSLYYKWADLSSIFPNYRCHLRANSSFADRELP